MNLGREFAFLKVHKVENVERIELRYRTERLNSSSGCVAMQDQLIKVKSGFIVKLLQNSRPASAHVEWSRYILEYVTDIVLLLRAPTMRCRGKRFAASCIRCDLRHEYFPCLESARYSYS